MLLERMIYFNQKFRGCGHDFHFIIFSEQTLCTCWLIWHKLWPTIQEIKDGEKLQNSKKKPEKGQFSYFLLVWTFVLLIAKVHGASGASFKEGFLHKYGGLKRKGEQDYKSHFFAKLKNGFLHIRTLGTKPLCCNFHLHHTFPPAQKIELAILYCCCCSGKLSNCCNLT